MRTAGAQAVTLLAREMEADRSAPSLSVVIPCLDGESRLPETLAGIGAQKVEGSVEVIVADDGSTDGTPGIARGAVLPWGAPTVVSHHRPRGRGAACNRGIEAASAPVVVIVDDDMTLLPGALEAHRRFHASSRSAGAIGRVLPAAPDRSTCFARFLAREDENRERQLVERRDDVPFALCLTGHFSAPRALLAAAGGFDERITRYGLEDIELAYRLGGAGLPIVYLQEAEALHRAYMTTLDRYLARHYEVGAVARELAERYPEGPFRDYLRVDGPKVLGLGRARPGLMALRISHGALRIGPIRRALGSRAGTAAIRRALGAAEAAGLDRIAHFGYHVARDVCYFQGLFDRKGAP